MWYGKDALQIFLDVLKIIYVSCAIGLVCATLGIIADEILFRILTKIREIRYKRQWKKRNRNG